MKLFESNKACFLLHVSNVLGMCRGMCVQSHASYAEACVKGITNNKTKILSKLLKTCKQKKTAICMKYDPQKIVNAMEAVESGTMSVTETSKALL